MSICFGNVILKNDEANKVLSMVFFLVVEVFLVQLEF